MMATWWRRVRRLSLMVGAGSLFLLGGCGLSDQQLAGIWQSVFSTALNTVLSNIITAIFTAAGVNGTT